jgi:hypothetical protein
MLALNLDVMLNSSAPLNSHACWILKKELAIPKGSEGMLDLSISLPF